MADRKHDPQRNPLVPPGPDDTTVAAPATAAEAERARRAAGPGTKDREASTSDRYGDTRDSGDHESPP